MSEQERIDAELVYQKLDTSKKYKTDLASNTIYYNRGEEDSWVDMLYSQASGLKVHTLWEDFIIAKDDIILDDRFRYVIELPD